VAQENCDVEFSGSFLGKVLLDAFHFVEEKRFPSPSTLLFCPPSSIRSVVEKADEVFRESVDA